ncbi:ester cyclase [Demequina sp. NBRC 110057]|uniref:ester cyclase n=1 Tax=Demequina sp. NBRC 110057 TaxID=1570346 RepID=UPI00190EEE9A|nr:ester cyclase [Demequina sp. NBRC 110057]
MSDVKDLVRRFLLEVRSGDFPERAVDFMAPVVLAHQVVSEAPVTVERSPANYAAHVGEMLDAYGRFSFRLDELLADGARVYARWTQVGTDQDASDGREPTGRPVTEVASAVYRVEDGFIVEYWIQIDRAGLAAQLGA